jgi:alanine dehydrogenase
MRVITLEEIEQLAIPDTEILGWIRQAFLSKSESMLPRKISQKWNSGQNFFNTMPAIIPSKDVAGIKVVSRYTGRKPAIMADLLLYEYSTGTILALMDATWLTTKRTGAVAAVAVDVLAKKDFESVAVLGLGQTGIAFLDMFTSNPRNLQKKVKLFSYKNHAFKARDYLFDKGASDVEICTSHENLIRESDVIVSAITFSETQIAKNEWFAEGCLVVPIHTRGFENCDLFFDRVFTDDRSHIEDFVSFSSFKSFAELGEVLAGHAISRLTDKDRLISYNIGIALHDVWCGKNVFDALMIRQK